MKGLLTPRLAFFAAAGITSLVAGGKPAAKHTGGKPMSNVWLSSGNRGFFANRWWIVAASFCSLLVGSGAINIFAFNVFVIPVTQELGLSRGDFSGALAWNGIFNALSVLFMGWALDRVGVRRVQLVGVLLFAAAVFMYSRMTASLTLIFLQFALAGFFGAAQTPVGYSTAVNQWFDRSRGLALGVATAGVGFGVIVVPGLASYLMQSYGWRGAYMGLSLAIIILAFIPNLLFIRDRPDLITNGRVSTDHLPGQTISEAFHNYRFWVLMIAFTFAVLAINGTITHVVPMLIDRGTPPPQAVQAIQVAGLAIILGRMISGWCLDRIWGPLVALIFFGSSIAGMGILATGATGGLALAGAMLCGAGIGAEIDIMGYLLSRYFGMRNFGKIYGLVFAAFNLGTGFGPAISGWTFEYFGKTYVPILMIYMGVLALVCVALFTLGEYAYKPGEEKESA
jgi:predicted MFS family arabinose efflux permease